MSTFLVLPDVIVRRGVDASVLHVGQVERHPAGGWHAEEVGQRRVANISRESGQRVDRELIEGAPGAGAVEGVLAANEMDGIFGGEGALNPNPKSINMITPTLKAAI